MAEQKGIGQGLRAWGEPLKQSHPELARQFNEPRSVGFQGVEMLDLPRPRRLSARAEDVLRDPASYFDQLATESIFIFLQPSSGLPTRRVGVSREVALTFLQETTAASPEVTFMVELAEMKHPRYGGNIAVNAEGGAVIEFKEGSQGEISAGTVAPEYRAWQDSFTGQWKYSFEDVRLREMVQTIMRNVPHDDGKYLPGLYEWQMVPSDDDEQHLEPWFIDYRGSDAFVR